MNALIEPIAAVVRVLPDGAVYGDPYTFAATARWLDPQNVEILGALRAPTPSEWRAMRVTFRGLGVKSVWFSRKSGAHPGKVEIKIAE